MATDQPSPPEGMETFDGASNSNEEIETIDLEPGDVLDGLVLDLTEGETKGRTWYRLKIKDDVRGVVRYFAHDQVKRACSEDRVEIGERLWAYRVPEEQESEIDGETVTWNPTKCALEGNN